MSLNRIPLTGDIGLDSESLRKAVSTVLDRLEADRNAPPAKRRKISDHERAVLVNEKMELIFHNEHQEPLQTLFPAEDRSTLDVRIPIEVDLRDEHKYRDGVSMARRMAPSTGGPAHSRMIIYAEDQKILNFMISKDRQEREGVREMLDFVKDIISDGLSAKPKWPQLVCEPFLTISRAYQGIRVALEFRLTIESSNEWTNASLIFSNKWWALLARAFPNSAPKIANRRPVYAPVKAHDFYSAVHVPSKTIEFENFEEPLQCTLLPFQRRTVSWMLNREGVMLDPTSGDLVSMPTDLTKAPPTYFLEKDADGKECYVSHVYGVVSQDLQEVIKKDMQLKGGILAEEMGLGKTCEILSLVSMHRRTTQLGEMVDITGVSGKTKSVLAAKTTLIITPSSILDQWRAEIEKHAPDLKVINYCGITKTFVDHDTNEIVREFADADIVLASYSVLSSELHYTNSEPTRKLRREKVYQYKRSPLIEMQWWRVCLDEAQMVEGGVSNAAVVARRVPRVNVWGVSGTPMKKDPTDLYGLLQFLYYDPFTDRKSLWEKLIKYNLAAFNSLFGEICIRHSKEQVRDELILPPQKRMLVSLVASLAERENYRTLTEDMCKSNSLSFDGTPLYEPFKMADVLPKLREWLVRLRQTCLHPEAGERNRKAFGSKGGPLRTVDEVLEVMIAKQRSDIFAEQRTRLMLLIQIGQAKEFLGDLQGAVTIWEQALKETEPITAECRKTIRELSKDKGKAQVEAVPKVVDRDEADEEDGEEAEEIDSSGTQPKTLLGTEKTRLRDFLEVEHNCQFFIAQACHRLQKEKEKRNEETVKGKEVVGKGSAATESAPLEATGSKNAGHAAQEEGSKDADLVVGSSAPAPHDEATNEINYEEKEMTFYHLAKMTRQEMMQDVFLKVDKLMSQLGKNNNKDKQVRVDTIPIERTISDLLAPTAKLADILNRQIKTIEKWRVHLSALLSERLMDREGHDEAAVGDELQKAVEKQEEAFAYMSALRALAADRLTAFTGELNTNVETETHKALKIKNRIDTGIFHNLVAEKEALKPSRDMEPMQIYLRQFRGTVMSMRTKAPSQAVVVDNDLSQLQSLVANQIKACQALQRDIEVFRSCANARIEYYRQLQAISDSLEDLDVENFFKTKDLKREPDYQMGLTREINKEKRFAENIAKAHGRHRYLINLQNNQQSGPCAICMDQITNGVMTPCGHCFCKDCFQAWFKSFKSCPQCRSPVKWGDLANILLDPDEIAAARSQATSLTPPSTQASSSSDGATPAFRATSIYTSLEPDILREIRTISLPTSYGTKIDHIVRHLLYLRVHEPNAKIVVFSQWTDVLDLLGRAMKLADVAWSSLEKKHGVEMFKKEETQVFLLHSKSQSAGLTLVMATHVFLCEPLLNTALELQAVSRVHRIGQAKPTTVWLFVLQETVEERVLELTTKRRLEMMGGTWEEEEAEMRERESLNDTTVGNMVEKEKGGGEVVKENDVWECLFGTSPPDVARGGDGE